MKKIVLRILGIAGILFALYTAYLLMTGVDLACQYAERSHQEAEQAYQSFNDARAKGASPAELATLELKVKEKTKESDRYGGICYDERSSRRQALIIGILSAVMGGALFAASFYVGRKKAQPPPPGPPPH